MEDFIRKSIPLIKQGFQIKTFQDSDLWKHNKKIYGPIIDRYFDREGRLNPNKERIKRIFGKDLNYLKQQQEKK